MLSGQVPWSDIPVPVPYNHFRSLPQDISNQYVSFLRDTSARGTVDHLVQDYVPPLPRDMSEQDLSFLRQCFSLRPADRPSADQILSFVREEALRCITGPMQTAARAVRLLHLTHAHGEADIVHISISVLLATAFLM